VKSLLELHPLRAGEPYWIGLFLAGAYQEVMGNLHNLFGDTNAVHIHMTPKGYQVQHVVKGDTMTEVAGLYLNVKAVRGTEKIFNSGIYNVALTMTLRIQADDVGPQHWSEFLGYFEQIFEVNPKQLAAELSNNEIHIYGLGRLGFNPGTMDMNREREYQLNLIAQNQKL
jgi:hypothetical protein